MASFSLLTLLFHWFWCAQRFLTVDRVPPCGSPKHISGKFTGQLRNTQSAEAALGHLPAGLFFLVGSLAFGHSHLSGSNHLPRQNNFYRGKAGIPPTGRLDGEHLHIYHDSMRLR
jgi:hypothetical protein